MLTMLPCSITCGLYANIVLGDYVRTILNLNDNELKNDSNWMLDPRGLNVFGPDGTPKGVGNQVSAEFNLVYRWHATISNKDEKWITDFMQEMFPGQNIGKISCLSLTSNQLSSVCLLHRLMTD